MRQTIYITTHAHRPGFVEVTNHAAIRRALAQYPGHSWAASSSAFGLDSALLRYVFEAAKNLGLEVKDVREPPPEARYLLPADLLPQQHEGVRRVLSDRRAILAWEMGSGKSRVIVEVFKQLRPHSMLIVCPKIVTRTWQQQFNTWAPELGLQLAVVRAGRKPLGADYRFIVCNYEMLKSMQDRKFDLIVLDELHYIKSAGAKRAHLAREIVSNSPQAFVVGLTGTPIPNQPLDLHEQISCIWPGRLGTYYEFRARYFNLINTGYAMEVDEREPLRADRLPELEDRLRHYMHRFTAKQLAAALPPLNVEMLSVVPKQATNWRELVEQFSGARRSHAETLNAAMLRAGPEKVHAAVGHALKVRSEGYRPVVLTYNIETAKVIGEALKAEGVTARVVTGTETVDGRLKKLDSAKADAREVPVCSMKSIGEGLTLVEFNYVIFAELYWTPGVVEQVLKRFHRLGSKVQVEVRFVVVRGSIDEAIAFALRTKLKASGECFEQGETAQQVQTGLIQKEMSADEWAKHILETAEHNFCNDEYA